MVKSSFQVMVVISQLSATDFNACTFLKEVKILKRGEERNINRGAKITWFVWLKISKCDMLSFLMTKVFFTMKNFF